MGMEVLALVEMGEGGTSCSTSDIMEPLKGKVISLKCSSNESKRQGESLNGS